MARPTYDRPVELLEIHSLASVIEAREHAIEARRKAAEPGVFHDIDALDRPLSDCELAAMVRGCSGGLCHREG